MQTKQRFSLNWGKGAAILTIALAVTLLCFVALLSLSGGTGNSVAVDWGSSYSPDFVKPPVRTLAVDWGDSYSPNSVKPPVRTLAVDWGNSYSPDLRREPPVRTLAVDWGSRVIRP